MHGMETFTRQTPYTSGTVQQGMGMGMPRSAKGLSSRAKSHLLSSAQGTGAEPQWYYYFSTPR